MSEFEAVLRERVDTTYRQLTVARRVGLDYETEQQGALLEDLFELARQHGLDAASWVDVDTEIPRQGRA
ncbi:hypothetical protein [Amycolatopsis sp. SID8362]|uniref:hypothetical protein n=1 Tax=Amycolatopsis sp. SID8362 TaxID=2690346 RepID=UPI001371F561|nr:hypothetical protein [Amycolatopsis sp. SID8362]NBH01720.1 hypothetical protein [Amycolatopsis sp. SID8362]NED38421.1 hypothetical protein [Amycolatopsis sp. SID8362]